MKKTILINRTLNFIEDLWLTKDEWLRLISELEDLYDNDYENE